MLKHSELLNAADRERSDWRAWWLVMSNWAAIIALLVLSGLYPSMLTISLLWVVLPGRQLGLSVLMHEAGHGTLFSTRRLNHWVGQWLCALPTLNDLPSYAAAHLNHHRLTGTPQDPDLANYRAYPVDRRSFRRKVIRDLTGQTGAKLVVGAVKGGLSHFSGQAASGDRLLLSQASACAGYACTDSNAAGHRLDLVALVCHVYDVVHVGDSFASDCRARCRA
jgi:fatty acid desaturase